MSESDPPVIVNVLSDLFQTACGVPTGTAVQLINRYRKSKADQVRELMLQELKSGRATSIQAASEDDQVEICVRLLQCAEAGAARINLRLLLKVIQGLSERGPLHASEFARFQRMLADLTREEIIFAATLYREVENGAPEIATAWKRVQQRLVPAVFRSEGHMRATAFSAQRSGLLMVENSIDATGYLSPSPLMAEVASLASFEEAFEAEGIK